MGGRKKSIKTIERAGKIVKIGKKEKMRIRTEMLTKKLKQFETDKQESKAKKIREKVVIVKDVKPLVDELEEIGNEDLDKKMKEKEQKKKPTKHTLKVKKQKLQFMSDMEFLKAASQHPEYVKNPLKTVTAHL